MIVIPPLAITDALLTASSLAEPGPGETAWNAATNYAKGDIAILVAKHRRYERLVAGTTAGSPDVDAANWRDAGPTNKWAMFDLERSSQSEASGAAIQVQVSPGRRVSTIGLVGLHGASVTIEVKVGATTVYGPQATSLLQRNTTSWLEYFYGSFKVRSNFLFTGLPLSTSAVIHITIQPTAGVARCGGVVLGNAEDLGTIVDQPVSEVLNFSKVTRDEFGLAALVKRRNVPVLRHRVRTDAARLNRLRELRDELDAVPALWSGVDARQDSNFFDTLLLVGIAKQWSIAMPNALSVVSDLQLEEI